MGSSPEKPSNQNSPKGPGEWEGSRQNGKGKQEKNTVITANETTPRPSRKAEIFPPVSYVYSSSDQDSDDEAFAKPPPWKKTAVQAKGRAGPLPEKRNSEKKKEEVPRRKKTFPLLKEGNPPPTVLEENLFVVGSLRRDKPNNPGNTSSVYGQGTSTSHGISRNIKNPRKRSADKKQQHQGGNGKPKYTAHDGHEATTKAFGGFMDYITSLNLQQNPYASGTGAMVGVEIEDDTTPQPVGTSGGGKDAFTEGTMPQNARNGQQQEQGGEAGTMTMDIPEYKGNEDGLNTAESVLVPNSTRRRFARRRIVASTCDSDLQNFPKTPAKRAGPSIPTSASSKDSYEDFVKTRSRNKKDVPEAYRGSPIPSSSDYSDSSDSSDSTESSFLEDSDSSEESDDEVVVATPPRTSRAVGPRRRAVPVPNQVAVKKVLFPTENQRKATTGEAGLEDSESAENSASRSTGRGVEQEYEDVDNNVAGDEPNKSKIVVPSVKGVKVDFTSVQLPPHYRLLLEIEKRTAPLSEEGMKEFEASCELTGMDPRTLWWKKIRARKPNPAREQYVLRRGETDHITITTYVNNEIAKVWTGASKARRQIQMENPEKKRRVLETQRILRAEEENKLQKALHRQEILIPVVYQIVCIREDEIRNLSSSSVLERLKAGLIQKIKIYTGEWSCIHEDICYRRSHARDPVSTVRIAANQGHRVFQLGVWECETKAEAEDLESLLILVEKKHSETSKQTEVLNKVPGIPISSALITSAITLGNQGMRMISFHEPISDNDRAGPYQLRYPMKDEQFLEITEQLRKHKFDTPTPSLTSINEECHVYIAVCIKQEDLPTNISTSKLQELIRAGPDIPLYVYAGYTNEKLHNGVRQSHFNDRNGTLWKFASEGGRVFSVAAFPCSSIKQGKTLELSVITVIRCYAENHSTIISMNKKWGDSKTCLPSTDTFLEAATIGSTGPALFEWCSKFTLSNSLQLPWKGTLVDITKNFKNVE